MAEHLVAGEDGLYRYRYSREAAASALTAGGRVHARSARGRLPDADRARRRVRARERGRGRRGRGELRRAGSRSCPAVTPCCGTRWPRRARGARVRADGDARMSLRQRPMTAAEFESGASGSSRTYAEEIGRRPAAHPEQAAAKAAISFARLLPDGVDTPNHSISCSRTSDGSAVGQLWIAEERWTAGLACTCTDSTSAQAERGRGFGREAMLMVEDEARAHGLDRIELNVWPSNHVAHALYRSLEFEETSLGMVKLRVNNGARHRYSARSEVDRMTTKITASAMPGTDERARAGVDDLLARRRRGIHRLLAGRDPWATAWASSALTSSLTTRGRAELGPISESASTLVAQRQKPPHAVVGERRTRSDSRTDVAHRHEAVIERRRRRDQPSLEHRARVSEHRVAVAEKSSSSRSMPPSPSVDWAYCDVLGDLSPLRRHRLGHLDVELHAVGAAARSGTPDWGRPGTTPVAPRPAGRSNVSPCH